MNFLGLKKCFLTVVLFNCDRDHPPETALSHAWGRPSFSFSSPSNSSDLCSIICFLPWLCKCSGLDPYHEVNSETEKALNKNDTSGLSKSQRLFP